MFDELEKILIKDVFEEKCELMEKQKLYFDTYFKFDEALTNDCEALKISFEKIEKLF